MKLLELIVKNVPREDIHRKANFFIQEFDGRLTQLVKKPVYINSYFEYDLLMSNFVDWNNIPNSDDDDGKIITREELMRAYDLVEQGYTLWFGGEKPISDGVRVDFFSDEGFFRECRFAETLNWNNIVAYRLSVVDSESDNKKSFINSSSPILCDLMRDISTSMPEMMSADMVELADYLISQGWGKHE